MQVGGSKDEIENKVDVLKQCIQQEDLPLSFGFVWTETSKNIQESLKADRKMYEDKKANYQKKIEIEETVKYIPHNHIKCGIFCCLI